MTLKKNIFDKLSLKKKITLNRQNKISEQLSNESKKNADLIEQIKSLLEIGVHVSYRAENLHAAIFFKVVWVLDRSWA